MNSGNASDERSRRNLRQYADGASDQSLEHIEYLVHQSTQGIHFMFDRSEIVRVHSLPVDDKFFYSFDNMDRIQKMLTTFIERPTLAEKRSFLERLTEEEYDLLVRAYFQLVENTILQNNKLRH